MSGRNILRVLGTAWENGERFDLKSTDAMKLLPAANDVGSIQIGDGSTDMDLTVFMGGSANYAKFDVGTSTLDLVGVILNTNTAMNLSAPVITSSTIDVTGAGNLTLADDVELHFGDANDVQIAWNGSALQIQPVTDDVGVISFGVTGKTMDVFFVTDSGKFVQIDAGADLVKFSALPLTTDSTITTTADGMVLEKIISEGDASVTVSDTELGGTMILTRAGVTAVTLPTPAAGNAGKWIYIISTTTNQHTITAGSNLIVAVADAAATTLTASAAIGNAIKLVSDGSLWYEIGIVGTWAPS